MAETPDSQTAPQGAIAHLWERQRMWSDGANRAKDRVERARVGNLALVVAAAALGALAAQPDWLSSTFQRTVSFVVSALLLLAGFVQSHYLTAAKVQAWTGARSASETLKAVAYTYLAGVSPDAEKEQTNLETDAALLDTLTEVEGRAFTLGAKPGRTDSKPLPEVTGPSDYRTQRTDEQSRWHADRYQDHDRTAKILRGAQLILTVTGSLLALIAGIANQPGIDAWVAAVSAMGAAVAAHIGAGQFDRLAQGYRVTAGLLEREAVRFDSSRSTVAADEAQTLNDAAKRLVEQTEMILARQTDGWVDMIEQAADAG